MHVVVFIYLEMRNLDGFFDDGPPFSEEMSFIPLRRNDDIPARQNAHIWKTK